MKHWSHIVCEGYCFGEEDENGNNPCGRNVPSPFCLTNGICPHFAWAEATERDAARFVKMRYILKDRAEIWAHEIWWKLRWWFWDRFWFNRRKVDEFFTNMKVVGDDDPSMQKWNEGKRKAQVKFEKWFPKAKKEWCGT